jgi:hypothetical protein
MTIAEAKGGSGSGVFLQVVLKYLSGNFLLASEKTLG